MLTELLHILVTYPGYWYTALLTFRELTIVDKVMFIYATMVYVMFLRGVYEGESPVEMLKTLLGPYVWGIIQLLLMTFMNILLQSDVGVLVWFSLPAAVTTYAVFWLLGKMLELLLEG